MADDHDSRYLHLTPAEVWERRQAGETYVPDAYEAEGFIHLTIGEANLIDVANRYYAADPRPYLALTLDESLIAAPVRFDDDSGRYPHVYGRLNVDAITSIAPVRRSEAGVFLGIGPD